MRDRREQILRLSCLVLGALLALQLARFIVAGDPAKGLVIPALPSLPPELDAQNKGTNSVSAKGVVEKKTNAPAVEAVVKMGASTTNSVGQTNAAGAIERKPSGVEVALKTPETNVAATSAASRNLSANDSTNAATTIRATNALPLVSTDRQSNSAHSTGLAQKGTNVLSTAAVPKSGTNSNALNASSRTNSFPAGRMAMGGKPVELPAEIKERVDRITQGEILGPVIRPMPMALLGIAGPNAFLRSSDGQTGMIKEGEKVGSLKLLRIGNNRVLIEEEGEKKELSIFSGLGSETLMPAKEPSVKEKKPNEPTTKLP